MSLQRQITLIFLLLLVATPLFLRWVYLISRPERVPLPPREEVQITIIPGWDLRDFAEYLVSLGFASTTVDVYRLTGEPANNNTKTYGYESKILHGKSTELSLEGYLAPETYRVFKDAALGDIIKKLLLQREKEFESTSTTIQEFHRNLTMASLIEKEARTPVDHRLVSDIMWRRLKKGWALQLDSTVHYAVAKSGTVFTTDAERGTLSPWNTYKYPGLPPGPICNPGLDAIEAAMNPEPNDYWYFLTGNDGKMYYAKTLEEHTANRYKYLR